MPASSMSTVSAVPSSFASQLNSRAAPLSPALLRRFQSKFIKRWENEWGGSSLLHGKVPGPNAVRLDGNDYLSISGHPDIVRAQVAALSGDTHYVVQSGIFYFDEHPSRVFEQTLAQFMGHEDGVLCQSGYAANLGLLQAIADENTPVYIDSLAHMSLWEGARAAKAPVYAFRHNDPEHLGRLLAKHGAGVVVVDSVYSTTGALCPLVEIVEVCEAHGAMIVVDESHSLGTHGPNGAGLCAQLGIAHRVQFITASLAKAFAARAGFFTTSKNFRNYVISESFPAIFSSGLLPHEIAALQATLQVIHRADAARHRLRLNTERLRSYLTELGYPIFQGTEQIISLEAGDEPSTKVLRDQLEHHGVFGAVFCAPATGRNRSMVRLTLNAQLTDAELSHVETAAAAIVDIVRPCTWPIARKRTRLNTSSTDMASAGIVF